MENKTIKHFNKHTVICENERKEYVERNVEKGGIVAVQQQRNQNVDESLLAQQIYTSRTEFISET